MWFAAIALPAVCASEDPPCAALQELDIWREEKHKISEPALIGARRNTPGSEDSARTECATYSIEANVEWHRLPRDTAGISAEPGKGCVVILKVGS